METEMEMEVGNRDADAEVAGSQRRMKELESDPDGRLKLELENNAVKLNQELRRLLARMRALKMSGVIPQREEELPRRMKEIGSYSDGRLKLELEKDSVKFNMELKRSLVEIRDRAVRMSGQLKYTGLKTRERKDAQPFHRIDWLMPPVIQENSMLLEEINKQVDLKYEVLDGSKDTMNRDSATGKESLKEGFKGERSRKSKAAKKIEKGLEKYEEWKKRKEEEKRNRIRDPDEVTDPLAYQAKMFEKTWNTIYLTSCGRFEDNTSIPCKRYTVNPAPRGGVKRDTLQVFSVKVAELTGGLQWPLNVFGMVALRDSLDHNRNVIFKRERDNCQTLTDENPYLVLTGPVRGVVFCGPVFFEVLLYVRGTTESDDKELSLLAVGVRKTNNCPLDSLLIMESYTSRLSTLDFELGQIVSSVEATISVKVISGPPEGFYGEFVASTDFLEREVLLHNSGAEELHLAGDEINLSRSVVSVESDGKLMITVKASDGSVTSTGTKEFEPLEKGITSEELHIAGLCQLEITVAWSLFSYSRA